MHVLEDANERSEKVITPSTASTLQPYVPTIFAGMAISEAIDAVLAEQARLLALTAPPPRMARPPAIPSEALAVPGDSGPPLDEQAARDLTERIKRATRQVCLLLLEAHQRGAWSALGYRTWEQYVQAEFGISRSRSYQLLDQGRVINTIQSSAGVSGVLNISAYAAQQVKPRLADIVRVVRERTAGRSEGEATQIAIEVIQAHRPGRGDGSPEKDHEEERDLARLYEAIGSLASMPSAGDTAAMVPEDHGNRLARLDTALRWLNDFADELHRRREEDPGMPSEE
jgi:hypothetical protein